MRETALNGRAPGRQAEAARDSLTRDPITRRRSGGESGPRWYVVETLPNKEGLAVDNLARQALGPFCPRFRKTARHARRQRVVLEPLFPGYVFVRFDAGRQGWRAINGTLGVRRLVGSEQQCPQPMAEAVMDQILARCEAGVMTRLVDSVEPGTPVRITAGPFAERLARIEGLDGRGRVSVLLDLLGQANRVSLGLDCLAPA